MWVRESRPKRVDGRFQGGARSAVGGSPAEARRAIELRTHTLLPAYADADPAFEAR